MDKPATSAASALGGIDAFQVFNSKKDRQHLINKSTPPPPSKPIPPKAKAAAAPEKSKKSHVLETPKKPAVSSTSSSPSADTPVTLGQLEGIMSTMFSKYMNNPTPTPSTPPPFPQISPLKLHPYNYAAAFPNNTPIQFTPNIPPLMDYLHFPQQLSPFETNVEPRSDVRTAMDTATKTAIENRPEVEIEKASTDNVPGQTLSASLPSEPDKLLSTSPAQNDTTAASNQSTTATLQTEPDTTQNDTAATSK